MQHPGWLLIIIGVLIAAVGVVWLLAPSIPWRGKLPGDVVIEREDHFNYQRHSKLCIKVLNA